jgi:transposase
MNWYKKIIKIAKNVTDWTSEEEHTIKNMLLSGYSVDQVAKQFDVDTYDIRKLNNYRKWNILKGHRTRNLPYRGFKPSQEQIDEAERLATSTNMSWVDISTETGIPTSILNKLNTEFGWREKKKQGRRVFTEDEIAEIGELIGEGYALGDIAKVFGVGRTVIYRINEEHGFRPKQVPTDVSAYKDEIINLFREGHGPGGILNRMQGKGITTGGILRTLRDEGLISPVDYDKRRAIELHNREKKRLEHEKRQQQQYVPEISPPPDTQLLQQQKNRVA